MHEAEFFYQRFCIFRIIASGAEKNIEKGMVKGIEKASKAIALGCSPVFYCQAIE